jgi:glucose-1-phosphate thymidylyltransferase
MDCLRHLLSLKNSWVGDNLLIGQGLGTTLQAQLSIEGASVLALPVQNPKEYGVVEFGQNNNVISLEEKPKNPKSNFAVPGIYFMDENAPKYARNLSPSARGELEIIDLLNVYFNLGLLSVKTIQRGTGWMDAGTVESLYSASELVRLLQERQGYRFNVPEEIAFNNGWIRQDELLDAAKKYLNTGYGEYLLSLIHS